MEISYHDGDNFIRNAVTVRCSGASASSPPARKMTREAGLPILLEALQLDLRVDSDDDAATLERICRGACDFIERRTGYVLLLGSYQVDLPGWWMGPLEVMRGPLREVTGISYLAGPNDEVAADLSQFYVFEGDRFFSVLPLTTFDRPQLWSEVGRVRLTFDAGFRMPDESGSDDGPEMDPGLVTILTMVVGHYYQNREFFLAGKLEQLELGAMAFLGTYRQYW